VWQDKTQRVDWRGTNMLWEAAIVFSLTEETSLFSVGKAGDKQ
jgi:hypothetical protein